MLTRTCFNPAAEFSGSSCSFRLNEYSKIYIEGSQYVECRDKNIIVYQLIIQFGPKLLFIELFIVCLICCFHKLSEINIL